MQTKSIRERISKLARLNSDLPLDARHALYALALQTKQHPERSVRIASDRPDFVAAVDKLKTAGLAVQPKPEASNLIRLVWADEDAATYKTAAEVVLEKFFDGKEPPPMTPAKTPKTQKSSHEKPEQLDWAFRRLRRQAAVFFADEVHADQPTLRRRLSSIQTGYAELKRAFTQDDNDLIRLCNAKSYRDEAVGKVDGWDAFMEWFFSHTITPGSRKSAEPTE